MELQNSNDKSKTKNVEDLTTKNIVLQDYDIPQSSNIKYIFNDLIGYNSPQLKNSKSQTTTEGKFQLFSQNIIKLWNTYSKQDYTSSRPTTLPTTSSSPNKNMNVPEIDIMKKILADYISNKNKMIHTTAQSPRTTELDIDRISDEIRRFLANTQNTNETNGRNIGTKEEVNKNNPQINTYTNTSRNDVYDNIIKETNNFFSRRPTMEDNNFGTVALKNKSTLPIADEVRLDYHKDLAKHNNAQTKKEMPNNSEQAISNNRLGNYNLMKDDSIFNTINNLYTNMTKDNNQKIKQEKPLPSEIIKEIAESVKAIVLNDLRKEISSITTNSTTTITETSTLTTKNVEGKGIEVTYMMEKFMELFQQFKSIEAKTITSGNSQIKVTEQKDVKHEFKGPVKVVYTSNKPAMSPYGVRTPSEQFAPIFVEQNNNVPNTIVRKFNVPPTMMNPVYQVHETNNYQVKTGLRLAPITIQTNSFEVPPLGIPIAKPILVHQNIIVTTKSPNLRPRLDTHHTSYIHHIDRYNIDDDFRSRDNWQKPLTNPKREFRSRARDAYTLNERDNYKIKKNDRSKFDNHNDDFDREYKPHFTKSDYDRMKLRNQEIKRFHERLENIDESKNSDEKEDCCKIRVASRQQLPLANAKKRSRYDDVHFRNFLKTQQKVNDMLEKILAAKTKADGTRSVETT
ncbi:uncharacterized protein LOC119189155 [Manduca sexta]|uniref:uncharacterized protein LOC119189155 n=1 Tax=Manduca sexta TaxID=7130 RepID=UPI001890B5B7|nr:uncharacterized protein LOC119189155 [Manduca sexta]